ncbi:hypothetical protein SDC9_164031 [bioreactor metagenome]|uniref:Uncharacterized protein n=1 Tax=bioreactor metagenome TaxID=1076179 RepID=A0A645FSJ0_9ZZZZ|nr:hypothetical protein [Oscillospiraceae bacterium]
MNRYKCPLCGGSQYSTNPNRADESCIYCGHKGTVLMNSLEDEQPNQPLKEAVNQDQKNNQSKKE